MVDKLIIRKGCSKDLQSILLIETHVFKKERWSRNMLEEELTSSYDRISWVATYNKDILGYLMIFKICKDNIQNILIFSLLILIFTSKYILMKYFEPMFFIILFILIRSKAPGVFLLKSKNIYFFFTYFFIYFISAYINDIFQITKNSIGVIRVF